MLKKEEKKYKMSKENALAEFQEMIDCFGFDVSPESTKRVVNMTMEINNLPMSIQQEVADSDAMVQRIMSGAVSFDAENEEIVYKLKKPIKTGSDDATITNEFRFGQFTRAKQKATKVPLNQCNFATLDDDKQDDLLMAMTGVSEQAIFNSLTTAQFNDLRMIAKYFFG